MPENLLDQNMKCCMLCPRMCRVNRAAGQTGFCGMGDKVTAARAALHYWEEPCLSGEEGSGTIFFTGCTLRCVYCQNAVIAAGKTGREISSEQLTEIFLRLQGEGANNINLVTPTHFLPQIMKSLIDAKQLGLTIPVVYNTSGYERPEILRELERLVDVWLPDFKYWDSCTALKYSSAPDYPERARAALQEMVRQAGKPEFDQRGRMLRGVIVRHLLLPGKLKEARKIVEYLYKTYGDSVYISMMNQYTPLPHVKPWKELDRKVTAREYGALVDYALDLGVENGFIQEGETASESFIPEFDCSL